MTEDFIKPLSDEFDNIYFIEGERFARYPYSNSMLIGDYLIDTGISPKRLRRLKKRFPINHVFLTHWHEDHISGNYIMKNVKFYCHSNDKLPIENVDILVIQSLLGHSSPRSTEPYIHPSMETMRQAMEKLPSVIYMKNLIKKGLLDITFQHNRRKKE